MAAQLTTYGASDDRKFERNGRAAALGRPGRQRALGRFAGAPSGAAAPHGRPAPRSPAARPHRSLGCYPGSIPGGVQAIGGLLEATQHGLLFVAALYHRAEAAGVSSV